MAAPRLSILNLVAGSRRSANSRTDEQGAHTAIDLRMFAVDAAIRLAENDAAVNPQRAAADVYNFLMTGSFDGETD